MSRAVSGYLCFRSAQDLGSRAAPPVSPSSAVGLVLPDEYRYRETGMAPFITPDAISAGKRDSMPPLGYLSNLGECLGAHALIEIPPIQIAEKPPSTDKSTPFTKLESSEARNRAAVAISSGRPIFPRGIRDSNIRFASSVRTWSCIGVAIGPGLSTFTRIFLPFSSLSQVRANERNAALLAEYTP